MKKVTSTGMIFFLTFYFIISTSCALAADGPINAYDTRLDLSVHDICNNTVKEATIILSLNNSSTNPSQHTYLYTNSSGESAVHVTPGTYDFSIQARNYKVENKTISIFNDNPGIRKIEFTLVPQTGYDIWVFFVPVFLGFLLYVCWLCGSSEKMKFAFILFLLSIFIPLLFLMSDMPNEMFFYVTLYFVIFLSIIFLLLYLYSRKKLPFVQKWEDFFIVISKAFGLTKAFITLLTILSWSLIAFYYAGEGVESVVISDLSYLNFPSYIVIGVTIGVLSYLMLTIKQMFAYLLPAYQEKNIVWECTRRIVIAPYMAIAGVYLIFYVGFSGIVSGNNTSPNGHFVFLFSIFAGMFTSTVEEWIYNFIRKALNLKDEKSTDSLKKYAIEESDLRKKLNMSEDMIYQLYNETKVDDIQSLANSDAKKLSEKLKLKYPENEIQYYIEFAQSEMKKGKTQGS